MPPSAKPNCKICKWIDGKDQPLFGLLYQFVEYPKWFVNQYGADDAFLGWLNLQPKECEEQISDLDTETLRQLGPVIKTLQSALFHRWPEVFPGDKLERVHTASFMETFYDDPPSTDYYHVHIHIIPRSVAIGRLIRRHVNDTKQYVPWDDAIIVSRMSCLSDFDRYLKTKQNVPELFSLLRQDVPLKEVDPS